MNKFFLISAVTMLLYSCGSKKNADQIPNISEAVPVKVMAPEKKLNKKTVYASGQFTTDDETILSFKTGGIISSLPVKEGEYIRKGQLLAALDLTEITAAVSQSRLALQKAQRDYERTSNLYRDSVMTLEQYQNAGTVLELAKEQLRTAEFNLTHSKIHALADGYVLKKFASQGQLAGPGTPVLQTNGAGRKEWILKAGISDKEWSLVKTGDRATVSTDAFPGKVFPAVVIRKSEGADPSNGAFTVELKLTAEEKPALAAGLFGTASINPSEQSYVWPVPYEALMDANGNEAFVFATDDGKTAKKIAVKIADIDKDVAYISSGLENVRNIILAGSAYLSDNSTITISK